MICHYSKGALFPSVYCLCVISAYGGTETEARADLAFWIEGTRLFGIEQEGQA